MLNSHILQSRPITGAVAASAVAALSHIYTSHSDEGGLNPSPLVRVARCESVPANGAQPRTNENPAAPSWIRRNLLSPIGIPLPTPRQLTSQDPALKLPQRYIKQRQHDENRMRKLLETAPLLRGNPEKMKALGEEIFEVTYGKNVTPQQREDFLIKYGCTGWDDKVVDAILEVSKSRGITEVGAGHGQWARKLSEAYVALHKNDSPNQNARPKRFDFVLAYDDHSNLPLNTHIYNAYTKPHHEFFGDVRKLETKNDMLKVLRSWACRGRVLMLVYPPPGPMALEVVKTYVDAAPRENDTLIFVGEGRGGANGDEAFFDYLESGDWTLIREMDVLRPPGDKGYEKLFILQHRASNQ